MSKKKQESFLKIPHWYFDTGLNIHEITIIAMISSWQRTNKEFFESKTQISKKLGCQARFVTKCIDNLIKLNVLKDTGKKGRVTKFKVNQTALHNLTINAHRAPISTNSMHGVHNKQAPGAYYKNPKNINKNILRVEEEVEASSSPKPREIHPTAFHKFTQDLDI